MNDTRGSGLQPYALAHEWMQDLEPRPQHEHKSGISISRYANDGGRIVRVRSTEQSVGIIKDGYSLMKNNK